ncbi:MAG: thioredoxin domain-containing protein, partial [Salibacteraceae bacterium]|nr:thioredoxin domain-containing protein [Salibacteraceae bacterium]
ADWCGPCQTMAPVLEKVRQKMGSQIQIVKINVDKNKAMASAQNVRSIPTLILYQNGKPVWRKSGLVTARDIVDALKKYVK